VVNPHVLCCFSRWSLTKAPSLHRRYPASAVLRVSPPPHTVRPVSRELPVDPYYDHRWGFPCCVLVSSAYMPSPLPRQVRWSLFARPSPSSAAFPVKKFGSAPAIIVSGPAQRSLSLWPVRSRSRPATFPSKAPTASLPPLPFRLLPGGANQFPGGSCTPLKSSAFHGALFRQSRLVILLKPTDFGLAVRNTEPDVGKVLLNEMGERDDCFFFGCAERTLHVQCRFVDTESLS